MAGLYQGEHLFLLLTTVSYPIHVQKHPKAARFTGGWNLLTDMQQLMPSSGKGTNVFRPSMPPETARAPEALVSSSEHSGSGSSTSNSATATILPATPQVVDSAPLPPSPPPSPPGGALSPVTTPAPSVAGRGKKRRDSPIASSSSLSSLSRLSSSTANSSESAHKRSRVTGYVAVNGIQEKLSDIGSTLRSATEHRIRHDQIRQVEREADRAFKQAESEKALKLAEAEKAVSLTDVQIRLSARKMLQQKEIYLDDESIMAMFNIFNDNPILAETYLGIERDSLRMLWVTKTLSKHGRIPDFNPPE